jgi:hypothetical protein
MSFNALLAAIATGKASDQTDSQALLYWFLYNAFLLDETDAADAICDRQNDKGIDGIWSDDETRELYLFQSKYTATEKSGIGDVDLKTFFGAAQFFKNPAAFDAMIGGKIDAKLVALLTRQRVREKIEAKYDLKLVFVSTAAKNQDTIDYLKAVDPDENFYTVRDQTDLLDRLASITRAARIVGTHSLTLPDGCLDHKTSGGYRLVLAPVPATDVVAMKGISDRSLFELNARKHLGRTRVNKELEAAIKDKAQHGRFPLFHNGITVICKSIGDPSKGYVDIEDYTVVNGCQSVVTLFDNKKHFDNSLRILARLIEVGDNDALAKDVTYRSNNQNGISLKDLRSNDRIQVALQEQVKAELGTKIFLQIKAGEPGPAGTENVTNEFAGQCILAFYMGRSYAAHQKFRIFGDDYEDIFRRADSWRIYLTTRVFHVAVKALEGSKYQSVAQYSLTRFVFMQCLAGVLQLFTEGTSLMENPKASLQASEKHVLETLSRISSIMVSDFDRYIETKSAAKDGVESDWDYKSAFKSVTEVRALATEIRTEYEKNVKRHPEDHFAQILQAAQAQAPTL